MPDTPASAPAIEFWFDFASGYAHFAANRLAAVPGSAEDGPLAVKVSWQIGRITLVMCGLLVPGVMIFIAYDVHGGPIVTALKWVAIALMSLSTAASVARRRSR